MANVGEWRPGRAYNAGDSVSWLGAGLVAARTHVSPEFASSPWEADDTGLYPEEDLYPSETLFPADPAASVEAGVDPTLWRAATPVDAMGLRQHRLSIDPVDAAVSPTYPSAPRRI